MNEEYAMTEIEANTMEEIYTQLSKSTDPRRLEEYIAKTQLISDMMSECNLYWAFWSPDTVENDTGWQGIGNRYE